MKRLLFGQAKNEFSCVDDQGREGSPKCAIFPILKVLKDHAVAIGTGFFINPQGLFLSAAHVVAEAHSDDGRLVGLHFLPDNSYVLRPLLSATSLGDIAIGCLRPARHIEAPHAALLAPVVPLALASPAVGTDVFTFAYPGSEHKHERGSEIKVFPSYFCGQVTRHYPEGRDAAMLPGPCFETSIVVHGGASGGPVFGPTGTVFAINSTGYPNDTVSFVSCVSSAMDLPILRSTFQGGNVDVTPTLREMIARGLVVAQ